MGFRITDTTSRVDARVVAIFKGHNSLKAVDEVNLYTMMVHYICTKFQKNISKGFIVTE